MFEKILKSKIHLTDTLYLRFDINAMIKVEQDGIDIFNLADSFLNYKKAVKLLGIGLAACLSENSIPESKTDELISRLIKKIGVKELTLSMQMAILSALPDPIIGAKPDSKKADFSKLYGLFVDVMGRTEQEFMSLTVREVLRRWDNYAVFNGYKKPDVTFTQYDD